MDIQKEIVITKSDDKQPTTQMLANKRRRRKVFLFGPVGSGKSTTGNSLGKANLFSRGNTMSRVTVHTSVGVGDEEWIVIDNPGLSDPASGTKGDLVFLEEIIRVRELLLDECPFDALVMVIKFDNKTPLAFKNCAERFVRSFSSRALHSLMLLCIQGNVDTIYSDTEFKEILYASEGYRYLSSKTNKAIPYCLWENVHKPYPRQDRHFAECLSGLSLFTQNDMEHAFNLIEKEIELINFSNYTRQHRPLLQPFSTNEENKIEFQLKLTRIKQKKIILIKPCKADSPLLNQSFEEFFIACDYIYNDTFSYNYSDAIFLSSLANDSKIRDHYLSSAPIDAFLLLIKIDKSQTIDFLDSARKFVSSFGSNAIKSLILLCIKTYEKDFYSQDDYRQCLEKTKGYKYLKSENEGSSVLSCLWDRKFVNYNQQVYFDSCMKDLKQFDKTMMHYSFQLIEKDVKYEQHTNESEN